MCTSAADRNLSTGSDKIAALALTCRRLIIGVIRIHQPSSRKLTSPGSPDTWCGLSGPRRHSQHKSEALFRSAGPGIDLVDHAVRRGEQPVCHFAGQPRRSDPRTGGPRLRPGPRRPEHRLGRHGNRGSCAGVLEEADDAFEADREPAGGHLAAEQATASDRKDHRQVFRYSAFHCQGFWTRPRRQAIRWAASARASGLWWDRLMAKAVQRSSWMSA